MITNIWYQSKKSTSWQPTDIAGCQLWLKADAGIIKDGSNYVSQWDDQSGNNNHAVQATGSAQPLWEDNQLNGKPAIHFYNGDYLIGNNELTIGTVFIVKKYNNPPYVAFFNSYPTSFRSTAKPYVLYGNSGSTILASQNVGSFTLYNNGIQTIDFAPITSAKIVVLKCTPTAFSDYFISSPDSYCWIGEIYEVVVYDTALSDTNRQLVETYLNTKYAPW